MKKPLREQDFYNDPAVNPHFNDLRELMYSSVERFSEQPMFLDKEELSDPYGAVLFREALEHMNGLGTSFLDLGLKGKKIVVIGENSYLWFLTYMAVVNGVGVIVPLDKDLTSEEIAQMTVRAGAAAVVHSDKAEAKVIKALNDTGFKTQRISMKIAAHSEDCLSLRQLITEGKAKVAAGDRRYIDMELDREAMCTLLFTSGTTGVAKGVMLSHKNIASNVVQTAKYVNVHNYVGLCVLPMHHCYAMSDQILVGTSQGNCVAINASLRHILDNMKEAKVNVLLGVPLIFEFMYKQIWKQAEKK
ncbi:MAG: AMP-binding protein, partial [Firmicutes bacterium]|nr:AMP-binding protein [Bacillota bacterium]